MNKVFILLIFLVCAATLMAQDTTRSLVQQVDENIYRIGFATLNVQDKSITIPANINMNQGLIEVLMCTAAGKTHESLLISDCSPTHLLIALITLGFNPVFDADSVRSKTTPDSFEIVIEWNNQNNLLRYRAEELIWNIVAAAPMQHTTWKFVGSPVYSNGQLAAEFEGTLIATYEMATILENGLPTRYDDTLYYVNEKLTPPVGTEVKVTIQPYGSKGESR